MNELALLIKEMKVVAERAETLFVAKELNRLGIIKNENYGDILVTELDTLRKNTKEEIEHEQQFF